MIFRYIQYINGSLEFVTFFNVQKQIISRLKLPKILRRICYGVKILKISIKSMTKTTQGDVDFYSKKVMHMNITIFFNTVKDY